RPTSVEPVNEIARTTGLEVSTPAIGPGGPGSTLNTPAGMPARSARTASASAEKGVSSAGRTIIGHPAASAAPALRAIIAEGKFQGVIAAVTPTGWRVVKTRHPGW